MNFLERVKEELDWTKIPFILEEGIEISQVEDDPQGKAQYVMKNKKNHYIHLSEQDYEIIQLLKEKKNIEEISLHFFMNRSLLIDDYLEPYLHYLRRHYFLRPHYNGFLERLRKFILIDRKKNFLKDFITREVIASDKVDALVSSLYKKISFLFTPLGLLAHLSLNLFCLPLTIYLLTTRHFSPLLAHNSLLLGLFYFVLLKMVLTSFHELGHALAIKYFKRTIHRGGIAKQTGLVAFFVDASDMLMRPKKERMIVMAAGLYANITVLSLMTLLTFYFNYPLIDDLFIKVFILTLLSLLINLNPLFYFDGYYILTDYLGNYSLREDAFKKLKTVVPDILKGQFDFLKEKKERWLYIYAFFSFLWGLVTFLLLLTLAGKRLSSLLTELFSPHGIVAQIFLIVGMIFFVLPLFISLFRYTEHIGKKLIPYLQSTPFWNNPYMRLLLVLPLPALLFFWPTHLLEMLTPLLTAINIGLLGFVAYTFKGHLKKLPRPLYLIYFLSFLFLIPTSPLINILFLGAIFSFVLFLFWSFRGGVFLALSLQWFFFLSVTFILKQEGTHYYFPFLLFCLVLTPLLFKSFYIDQPIILVQDQNNDIIGDRAKLISFFNSLYKSIYFYVQELYGPKPCKEIFNNIPLWAEQELSSIEFRSLLDQVRQKQSQLIFHLNTLMKDLGPRLIQDLLNQCYWVQREIYNEYIDKNAQKTTPLAQNERVSFLQRIPFFSELNENEVEHLLNFFYLRTFKEDEVLILQGTTGDECYILLSGKAKVTRGSDELAILGRGDLFGERHLYLGDPRNATITTISEGEMLCLNKDDFHRLLKTHPSVKQKIEDHIQNEFKFASFLKEIPLFKQLDQQKLKILSRSFRFGYFKSGDFIIRQGDQGDAFYVIKEGRVDVMIEQEGDLKIISTLEEGGLFGEVSLFYDVPRTASIVAKSDTVVFILDRKPFQQILRQEALMQTISSRRLKEREALLKKAKGV